MEHDSNDGEDLQELVVNSPPISDHDEVQISILKRSAALFLMKTKEISRVSQVALDSIVCDVTELFQARVEKLKHDVKSVIQHSTGAQVSSETMVGIDSVFNEEEILRPLSGLEYEYQQMKYFKEELNMLVCHSLYCPMYYKIILWMFRPPPGFDRVRCDWKTTRL